MTTMVPAPSVPGSQATKAVPEPLDPRAEDLAERIQADRPAPGTWPRTKTVPVSVLIPVKNEESNLVECLRRLTWADQIVIVDSQSTDLTVPLAQAMGAEVYQFHFSPEGWPKKKNWALENIPWRNEWVFIIDADEHATPELAREIEEVVTGRYRPSDPRRAGCGDGYWINRKLLFLGRWIKGCGYYPSWNVRLFRHRAGRYERIGLVGQTDSGDNEVHEHVLLATGEAGYLKSEFIHYAYPHLSTWVEKHNRYTNWEAHVLLDAGQGGLRARPWGGPIERRRWLKRVSRRLPFRPTLRFLYGYILQRGFLDGYPGFVLCRLMAWYEFMSIAKHYELQIRQSDGAPPVPATSACVPAVAPQSAADERAIATADDPSPAAAAEGLQVGQLAPESSPWTFREKVIRAIWMLGGKPLFRLSFHNWYRFRAGILRLFGARIGHDVRIRPTVHVEIPWNLDIRDGVTVGDYAILYSLGTITIGERTIISQYAHLCAGTHDHTDRRFPLIRDPIVIGPDAWIGADAYVGPNVRVGRLSVLGARSSAYKDLEPQTVYVGNPARAIKKRELH